MQQEIIRSPQGLRTRILLSSVFGPYARDDEYGSRAVNPMELYQNQVTRVQGGFSLRMFHRTFGLMMIQANIEAPCTLLDFPSQERFIAEIRENDYDVIGIGAIIPNVGKVKRMCELIRQYRPHALIVVGGHIANKDDIQEIIDADAIVRDDGIRWFRRFLGEAEDAPIRHPAVLSGFGARIMGVNLGQRPGGTAAILIPSVGCPVG
ncbi:MAG: cobalamin B12-binding domain-containing protein, partial [Syntrophales bacterium]|nr:cobalamin B12-binding domain-containing protein [Syntrophales bacterium]